MDPYSVVVDEIVVLHNPQYGRSEQYQQITNISEKVKSWVQYEYFYSLLDKLYFARNELLDCLAALGINHRTFRRDEWILIRKAIGKPRRLSGKFLAQERERLKRHREISRELIFCSVLHRPRCRRTRRPSPTRLPSWKAIRATRLRPSAN